MKKFSKLFFYNFVVFIILLILLESFARFGIFILRGSSTIGLQSRNHNLKYQPFVMFGSNWEHKLKIEFMVGTMIELPRAAIKAKDIAKHAEFFSFGTNDLTQTTFGISRDDSGKFLNDYLDNKIFSIDPFISIDDGVGDLIKIAVEKGKSQNKNLKLGICGEHGGDPNSILFCSKAGLNYVSCSPYRVPVARLAAAQAELKNK